MASLIKIGNVFINLDRVVSVEDRFASTKEDSIAVRFGTGENDSLTFTGREADDLRTWLNSRAVNLREATEPDTAG
jgi:hypothetical protein